MGQLKVALEAAISGRGRVVMLVGEPGIGKTRTAQELSAYGQQTGVQVLWGRCYEGEGAPPYWPWVQVLRSYIGQQDAGLLRSHMGAGAADIAEIIPGVLEKLPGLEPPPPLEPEQARFRLFDSITTFLRNSSRDQPLLLVLDDLHWADPPSLILLQFLARQLAESRLLVVGCYRDVELSRQHPLAETLAELSREPAFQSHLLLGLSQEDAGSFIQVVGGISPSQKLVETLYAHTEGNPFFMSEVIRLLRGSGSEVEGTTDGLADMRLPVGVRAVIGQRLNRRSQPCNQVLTVASVIGREFSLEQLGALREDLSAEGLVEVMEEALSARLVEEVPGPAPTYRFCHALIQETLVSELSAARRVLLHARVAQGLEKLYGPQAPACAAELAYHFGQAEAVLGPEKTVKYSLLAGERALATYAHEEAAMHFRRALQARGVPPALDRPAVDAETAGLLFGLGRAQAATSERFQVQEAFDNLARAFDYYIEAGDIERAVAVAENLGYSMAARIGAEQVIARALTLVPPDSHQAGRLLVNYGQIMGLWGGDYPAAREALARALAIARREGDAALEMWTLAITCNVANFHLCYGETLEHSPAAIELAVRLGVPHAEVQARYNAVTALTETGDLDGAHQHNAAMLVQAERIRNRFWLTGALWKNSVEYRLQGLWGTAREIIDRGLSISPRDTALLSDRVLIEFETGNFAQGETYLERLLEEMRQAPNRDTGAYADPARVLSLIDRITDADRWSDTAESAARAVLCPPGTPPSMALRARIGLALLAVRRKDIHTAGEQYAALAPLQSPLLIRAISAGRLLGLLAHTMGRVEQALGHFEDALDFCRRAGYWPELAWACCDYAQALLAGAHGRASLPGHRDKAGALLEEALAIARELGMRPLLERAGAVQSEVESRRARGPEFPDGLTQREVEVLRLIAQGKSNPEIAKALFISPNTVAHHVTSIINKTGTANRAQAAAHAARQGLI